MMKLYSEIGGKAISLDDITQGVRDQFYAEHPSGMVPAQYEEIWIPHGGVFEDYVIVKAGEEHYRVDYTTNDDGEIDFADRSDWIPYEKVWQPKSLDGAIGSVEGAVKSAVADRAAVADDSTTGGDVAEDNAPDSAAKGSLAKANAPAGDVTDDGANNCDVGCGRSVKALGRHRIGEYLVLWGAPDRKDLAQEFFSPKTEELTEVFRAVGKIPILYQHAMSPEIKSSVVGTIDILQSDEIGLWAEGEMIAAHEYRNQIAALIDNGVLHWSSGTLPGARAVSANGHIDRWAIVEASLTPTPMEYRMVERPVAEVKAAYKSAGLEFPAPPDDGEGAEEARQTAVDVERERITLLGVTL